MSEELPVGDLASILSVVDSAPQWMDIPEWGFRIQVQAISKATQVRLKKAATRNGAMDTDKFEGLLLVNGIVNPKVGPADVDRLYEKSSGVVDGILKRILQLSHLMEDNSKEAEADFPE